MSERTVLQGVLDKIKSRIANYEADGKKLVNGVRVREGVQATTVEDLHDAIVIFNGASALKILEDDVTKMLEGLGDAT